MSKAELKLEVGAVYRCPTGRMARLDGFTEHGELRMVPVDAARATVDLTETFVLSQRMAPHLALAWHEEQWSRRVVAMVRRDTPPVGVLGRSNDTLLMPLW